MRWGGASLSLSCAEGRRGERARDTVTWLPNGLKTAITQDMLRGKEREMLEETHLPLALGVCSDWNQTRNPGVCLPGL